MSLVRRYNFKEDKVDEYKFQVIDFSTNLSDLTEDENNEVQVVRLIDLIKHIDYKISQKELWDMIEKEEQSSEWMFLLDSKTNRGYHINTTGKLRDVENIVLDDEGVYFFLENLRCEKSKKILLEEAETCRGMGVSFEIHGKSYTF